MRPVAICVPARDEAALLPRLVRSLAGQRGFTRASPLRLVIVANNCTDATVPALRSLERELRGGVLAFEILDVRFAPSEAHVGSARRLAMDRGAAWLERDGAADGILVTTDADAVADPGWVGANRDALEGADLVGGRLIARRDDGPGDAQALDLDGRVERYWAAVRALEDVIDPAPHDPPPRHGDHTGASLALGVARYREVGGLPSLACGEDLALVSRLRCRGGRVRHCPHVAIAVSARLAGRVDGGMASEMMRRAALGRAGGSYDLPPALHWQRLFERRAALRAAWTRGGVPGAGGDDALAPFGLDGEDVRAISPETCPNDIAFVERAMLRDSQRGAALPPVAVDHATVAIETLAREREERRRREAA